MYKIVYTRQGLNEKKIAEKASLREKASKLLDVLKDDLFQTYPHYEKLVGNLSGAYSRRINRLHRLVYMVYEEEKNVLIRDLNRFSIDLVPILSLGMIRCGCDCSALNILGGCQLVSFRLIYGAGRSAFAPGVRLP